MRDFRVVNGCGLLLECSMWKKEALGHEGGSGEGGGILEGMSGSGNGNCGNQVNDDDDLNDENDHRRGQITLNIDDWDESKERGHFFLQAPESFEDS
jgi:hypothetical protein